MSASPSAALDAWARRLSALPLPVMHSTRRDIDSLRADPDRADAHLLADIVLRDPLMCAQLLAHAAGALSSRLSTPVETVTGALVLMGVEPFFRVFGELPVLDDALAAHPRGLEGAMAVIDRSHCAARIAAAIAIHRQDVDVELLHQAALLHDVVTVMAWCVEPVLCERMALRQRLDPALRTADVQREELGVTLHEVGRDLMARWQFAPALRRLGEPHGNEPGPRTVALAVRIARHVAMPTGWHNPALPDDFAELGQLMNLPPHAAGSLVRRMSE
ncbi:MULTISPECIES: HDOD domain-containing protein [Ramlibacter]|uniref:HDOD domain-containing protein n=1 Tax=Ramlibacter aquaticus TaxID=2780094 RepID=A0ABR9SGR9_9BURK|nr:MULTISPECIES: HDOD domain-containing protein [Ramlibacter]MBE7941550.1 HDOD domain-containing protein [Ramlibacter aquaticus]